MPATISQPPSQVAVSAGIYSIDWPLINEELSSMLLPLHAELANKVVSTDVAAEELVSLINAHPEHYCVLRHVSPCPAPEQHHRSRSVVRLTDRLARLKNAARRNFDANPGEFLSAVRAHNRAKRAADVLSQQRSSRKQEKAFKRNLWKFSKSACDAQNAPSPTFGHSIHKNPPWVPKSASFLVSCWNHSYIERGWPFYAW